MPVQQPEVSRIAELQLHRLLDLQRTLLDIVARDGELVPRLEAVCGLFEAEAPGLMAAVMPERLEFVCAPSLPPDLLRKMDGVRPGADAGSCAYAAWSGTPELVDDAETDSRWSSARLVARDHGIRSCWSAPVHDHGYNVVGTFALTSLGQRLPSRFLRQLLDLGAAVVGLLFDQQKGKDQRAADDAQLRRLALVTAEMPSGVVITDREGHITWINESMRRRCDGNADLLVGHLRSQELIGELTDPNVLDGLQQAITAGQDFAGTLVNYGPVGPPFVVQLACRPLVNAAGTSEGALISEVDITAHKRLAQFNALLAGVSETVAGHEDPVALMQSICDMAVLQAGLNLAWIGHPGADGWFDFLASAGPGIGYLNRIRVSSDPALVEGNGSSGRTWREGRCHYNRSFADTANLKPWQALAKQYGFRASATLPIHCNGAMWAVFTVYHAQEDVFDTDLRVLLEALASNISRGLDRIELTRRERSNQLLNQAMLDTVTVGVILLKQRVVMRANQCAASFFGADDAEALVGKHAASLYISPDEGAAIPARIEQAFRERGRAVFEMQARRLDGGEIWLRIESAPFEREGFDQIWSLVDITEKHAAVEGQALMVDALASVQEGVLITDHMRHTVYVNRAFEELTGYSFEDIRGRSCAILQGPETSGRTQDQLRATLGAGRPFKGEILNYRKDGSSFWNLLTITPLRNPAGELTHFVGVQRDVSDVCALNARLEYLAFHDDLTELPNRRGLDRHLSNVLEQAFESDTMIALGEIDLDDFKLVNDRYGAASGDRLLHLLSARMRSALGPGDFIARVGGDEFAVVFAGIDRPFSPEQLGARLEQLGRVFAEPFQVQPGCSIEIAPSMGVALYPTHALEPDMLIRLTREALFHAKQHKLQRTHWWMLHGADATNDVHVEHALNPYGEEAQLLLEKFRGGLEIVRKAFIGHFYQGVADEPSARSALGGLDASEVDDLKCSQADHLRLLTEATARLEHLHAASEKIGRMHALIGLESFYLLHWMSVYREHLSAHFNAQPMSARQRYRLVQLIEQRLQDDMQAQLETQTRTLAPYADMAMLAMPEWGASWAAAISVEISQLAAMPDVVGALLLRQSAHGAFSVEASAGLLVKKFMDLFAADGSPGSSSAITPPGGSLLIKAWQTGTVQSRHSFKQEVPGEYWSALLGEPAQHMGVRAAVHVPVLDGKNSSVALLIMLGGTPNQFGSAFMRQFARNLQQRWSEIWQRGSRPPPAVPQELAISYRERLFNGGLRMYVQPVIDLRDWRLVKAEALARLELADGRMLAPSEFLPLLSQVEIDRLFRMGLDQALKALVGWEAQGLCLDIAINLPPHTLADPACAQWVFEAVTRHGVVPHRLTMEMLESQHVNEDARDAGVQRLLALGVHLAMDDLGSGYSSLRRLASLPFSSIKVDQDLLKRIHSEPVATISLISAVVQMGRDFGCDVVVEGLEEPGMIEVARLLGAHLGQGYGIARPMPAADLVRWNSNFRCTDRGQSLQTYLGALAFQWSSIRHRSMHASILEACPMTTVLKEMGMDAGDVNRLHECAHRDPHNATVARELLDCLESIVRGQEPPPA